VEIIVELPNDLTQRTDPAREALEALAIAGYRSGQLTHHQAGLLLGLTRVEFDGFLKARNILDHAYDTGDLHSDMETLRKLKAVKTEGKS